MDGPGLLGAPVKVDSARNNSEGRVNPDKTPDDWVFIPPGLEKLMSDDEVMVMLHHTTNKILVLELPILKLLCEWLRALSIASSKVILEMLQEWQKLQKESKELKRQ